MCENCDNREHTLESDLKKLSEDQLQEHHLDLTLDVAYTAREIADLNNKIQFLSNRLTDIDLELELREAKKSGKMN